jgi:hypothetical protein
MLAEGVTDAAPPAASVPDDLRPRRVFTRVTVYPERANDISSRPGRAVRT